VNNYIDRNVSDGLAYKILMEVKEYVKRI